MTLWAAVGAVAAAIVALLAVGAPFSGWIRQRHRTKRAAIKVRRVTEPNDQDLPAAYDVYQQEIPENEQDPFTDIQRWLEEAKAARRVGKKAELDEYLFIGKASARVCAFFYGQYYFSHRLFLLGYHVIDRKSEEARRSASMVLLKHMVKVVRHDHPDCQGIAFELEMDSQRDPRTPTAKERLFAVHAKTAAEVVLRRFDFEYLQPRLSLWDLAFTEERQHLVYGRLHPPALGRTCDKQEALHVLDAVYNCWYADYFEDDPEKDKEYRAYVQSLYKRLEAQLPEMVPLI